MYINETAAKMGNEDLLSDAIWKLQHGADDVPDFDESYLLPQESVEKLERIHEENKVANLSRISMIKIVRDCTARPGEMVMGLREAKTVVDAWCDASNANAGCVDAMDFVSFMKFASTFINGTNEAVNVGGNIVLRPVAPQTLSVEDVRRISQYGK